MYNTELFQKKKKKQVNLQTYIYNSDIKFQIFI